MIGSFILIGKENYIQMNTNGTLEKLRRLEWYDQLRFAFIQAFKGKVNIEDVRKAAKKSKWGIS